MSNQNPELESAAARPIRDEAIQPERARFRRDAGRRAALAPSASRCPSGSISSAASRFSWPAVRSPASRSSAAACSTRARAVPSLASARSRGRGAADARWISARKLYSGNCANCHQASGAGQPGSYPPLAGSEWVLGSKERLAAIMLARRCRARSRSRAPATARRSCPPRREAERRRKSPTS